MSYKMKVFVLVLLTAQWVGGKVELTEEASRGSRWRAVEGTEYRALNEDFVSGRRHLEAYQLCLACKCCSSATECATMPCCFAIDCQLPNKPFGVCAFVPKTCNCTSCPV